MSCFICSDKHIAVIANHIQTTQETFLSVKDIAYVLKGFNYLSVNERYNENDSFKTVSFKGVNKALESLNYADVLHLAESLKYQSSDSTAFDNSIAEIMLEKLINDYSIKAEKLNQYSSCWTI